MWINPERIGIIVNKSLRLLFWQKAYKFIAGHSPSQYVDGLRGPLIIHDPDNPYDYDEEIVMTITDWYHGIF